MTFLAICNANGPVSFELEATDAESAKAEFEALIPEELQEKIDDGSADLDDAIGIDLSGTPESDWGWMLENNAELIHNASEPGAPSTWAVWAVDTDKAWKYIIVGSVDYEYGADDDVDTDDATRELMAYVHVEVEVCGESYSVACMIGKRESEHGNARASGAMTSLGGGPDAWFEDRLDWEQLPRWSVDAVKDELNRVAGRLWRETMELREAVNDECDDECDDDRPHGHRGEDFHSDG